MKAGPVPLSVGRTVVAGPEPEGSEPGPEPASPEGASSSDTFSAYPSRNEPPPPQKIAVPSLWVPHLLHTSSKRGPGCGTAAPLRRAIFLAAPYPRAKISLREPHDN